MSKYWEETVEMNDRQEYQDWLSEREDEYNDNLRHIKSSNNGHSNFTNIFLDRLQSWEET